MHSLTELPDRLQSKITISEEGCWLWHPVRKDGYTLAYWEGKRPLGHRLVWELLIGPIGEGMQLDHVKELCTARNCVNPAHLEEVTPLENTRRSNGNNAKTHCPAGHAYTPENTLLSKKRLHRMCKKCTYGRNRDWWSRNRAKS
jgi:hypothetical protein